MQLLLVVRTVDMAQTFRVDRGASRCRRLGVLSIGPIAFTATLRFNLLILLSLTTGVTATGVYVPMLIEAVLSTAVIVFSTRGLCRSRRPGQATAATAVGAAVAAIGSLCVMTILFVAS